MSGIWFINRLFKFSISDVYIVQLKYIGLQKYALTRQWETISFIRMYLWKFIKGRNKIIDIYVDGDEKQEKTRMETTGGMIYKRKINWMFLIKYNLYCINES